MRNRAKAAGYIAALVAAAGLTSCVQDAADAGMAATAVVAGHDDAFGDRRIPYAPGDEVAFIDFFGDHHARAIEMARMALEQGSDAEVKTVALLILDQQTVELGLMARVREEVASEGHAHPPPDDPHASAEMEALAALSGAELDRHFLEGMIAHHGAGLAPAQRATPNLERGELRDLARSIFDGQSRQIGEMIRLLGGEPVGTEPATSGADAALVGDRRIPLTPQDDLAFVDFFAPHHEEAIAMAAHEAAMGGDPHVRGLAQRIVDTQSAELEVLRAARVELAGSPEGEPPPEDPVSKRTMDELASLEGEALDRRFLEAMIPHHGSGLAPAKRAEPHLVREDLQAIRTAIFEGQSREIGEMLGHLARLGGHPE